MELASANVNPVGRTVNYMKYPTDEGLPGISVAALVTAVDAEDPALVSLVTLENKQTIVYPAVPFSEAPAIGHWSWRVGA